MEPSVTPFEPWLETLRAWPRGLVLTVVGIALAAVLIVFGRALKWMLYAALALGGVVFLVLLDRWLQA